MTSPGAAEDEVVELTSELIRIDTTNTGDLDTTTGEREAAEYVAGKLTEVGYEVEVLESGAPGRSNVFCRLAGADPSRGGTTPSRLNRRATASVMPTMSFMSTAPRPHT